jgi:hypothetical protein
MALSNPQARSAVFEVNGVALMHDSVASGRESPPRTTAPRVAAFFSDPAEAKNYESKRLESLRCLEAKSMKLER